MEIPVQAETLVEKAGSIFESAGSMDLLPWIDSLLVEIPKLIESFISNTFPASFLTNVLSMSEAALAKFPQKLLVFVVFYLLCGVVTLALRFTKGQKSLNSIPRQITNVILTWCCTLFVPMLVLLARATIYVLKHEVAPYQGSGDLVRFLGASLGESFYLILAFGAVLFTVWMPISSAIRYLKVHKLGGIPHMVFDIGFGFYILAVLLLSAWYANRMLCLLIALAAVMLCVVQIGGYISEVYDSQAVHSEASRRHKGISGEEPPAEDVLPDTVPEAAPEEAPETAGQEEASSRPQA